MTRIRKSYFTLDELQVPWGLSEPDLRYVAENGLLRLSVRVVALLLEFGAWERTAEGDPFPTPCAQRHHDGLLELERRDVFVLFRDGVVTPRHFARPGHGYASLMRATDVISVRRGDLVVCREERLRFEAEVLPTLQAGTHDDGGFSEFSYQGRRYRFTRTQAGVLQFLHDAALRGTPWQSGKAALAACGSQSLKLSDLFKRRPEWRDLIEADGCGCYRLRPALVQSQAA